jgi:hypothetical protein
VDRKTHDHPIILGRSFLAVSGTIQPDVVRSLVHSAGWDDGFLDRILFAFPSCSVPMEWSCNEVSETTHADVKAAFDRLYALEMDHGEPAPLQMDGPP